MNKAFILSVAVPLFAFTHAFGAAGEAAGRTAVLPLPRSMKATGGVYVTAAKTAAEVKAEYRTDASLKREAYRLKVAKDGVEVVSADADGKFYALVTLGQLAVRTADGLEIPCVEIEDSPAYPYRGVMLDESRHFFGKQAVLKLIDLMAEYKFNHFHWHLTDDQGWRLELKRHPEVVRYGATRPGSPKPHTWWDEDGVPYGPYFYTQEDVKEILARAKERHVRVYPEIDMPGHIRSLIAAHPELMCEGGAPLESRSAWAQWGITKDVLCVTNPKTLAFIEDVIDEVCELFPDAPYFFMGGDECPTDRWKTCPSCRAVMEKEGIKHPHELQHRFTKLVYAMLKKRGRRLGGWCSLVGGGGADKIPKDVFIVSGCYGIEAYSAQAGFETVSAPNEYSYFYFNQGLPPAEDPYEYGWFWTGSVSVQQIYSFRPGCYMPRECRRHVAGGEAHLWSEYTKDPKDLEWKLWPRLLAMSESLWTAPDAIFTIGDFKRRATVHSDRLRARGVNVAPFHIDGFPKTPPESAEAAALVDL